MKLIQSTSLFFALAIGIAGGNAALADEHDGHDGHDNHGYVHHEEWKKGATMRKEDWQRGERVDYHQHHLKSPPRGYEWRQVDGNYVLAAVATGVIASAIIASEGR
jgi:Ni/Co efflux regulator RcnB